MKKVVFGFILFILPFIVFAVEPDYLVEGYYSKIEILENGSVKVKEAIVLDGDFNGYERSLLVSNSNLSFTDKFDFSHDARYNPKAVTDIKVATFEVDKINLNMLDNVLQYSEKVKSVSNGSKNKYTLKENNNSKVIKSYYSCTNCTTAFYFEYTLKDAVILHNDIAEVYSQIFTYDYVTEDMGTIEIEVSLPSEDSESLMWVHGNVYGKVERIDADAWKIVSDEFPSDSELDYRILFNKNLITNSNLTNSNQDALSSIKEIEKERAEEREKEIEKILAKINFCNVISVLYIIFLIVIIIYVFIKYDKEFNVNFSAKYYREFIEDYDVEVIDYLMKKQITPNAMSASIMNLIYKKKIKAEALADSKKDYEFVLLSSEGLSDAETKLVGFLFEKVGANNKFTTKQLKSYAKSTKTYEDFNNSFTSWKKIVEKEGKKQEFFLDVIKIKLLVFLYLVIGLLLWFYQVSAIKGFIIGHILIFIIIPVGIYILCFSKKTKKGALHYKQWLAFKNFLNDFGTFELKELPEIVLWERYLVYAVVFGLAKKVQKSMNVIIKENNLSTSYVLSDNTIDDLYFYSSMATDISSSVNSAHELAVSTAANQHSSNSLGTGGGFSSGGGFGGGGGGGHGF